MYNICNSFSHEYDGRLGDSNFWRDRLSFSGLLQVIDTYQAHTGCVNTIQWDHSGQYILSGSDDRHIAISNVLGSNQKDSSVPIFKRHVKALSNIFSAIFFPNLCNDNILVGFRCGCLVNINCLTSSERPLFAHKMAIYNIIPLPDHKSCFFTLSHDRTVRFWDMRLPSYLGRDSTLCNRNCYYADVNFATSQNCRLPLLAPTLEFSFPVTAGDVHSLDGSRKIALATVDGFIRIFDLRRLFDSSGKPCGLGEKASPQPYQIIRPLGLAPRSYMQHQLHLDYGPLYITCVRFEPIPVYNSLFTVSRFRPNMPGNCHLLANYMYSSVYLFDLGSAENRLDDEDKQMKEINIDSSSSIPTPDEEPSENHSYPAPHVHSNILLAMLLASFMERRRAARLTATSQPTDDSSEYGGDVNSEAETDHSEVNNNNTNATTPTPNPREAGDSVSPHFQFISEAEIIKTLASFPRARQIFAYTGLRSMRTVIKDACYWGNNYILSGSECGHLLVWDRHSGELVSAIKADESVVNRIQPHPFLPYLATSGMDHSIKLIQPSVLEVEDETSPVEHVERRRRAAQLIGEQNVARTREALRSGGALVQQLASFRIGRAARNFLLRLAESRNSREDSSLNE